MPCARESRGERGVEQRDIAVGNRGRHLGRDHFGIVGQIGAARRLVAGANRKELLGLEVREDALRLEEVGKAAVVQARAPELVGLFLELGLDAPIDFLHQAAEVVVVALERLLDEIRDVLRDCVVADELDQIIFVVLRETIGGRVGRGRRVVDSMHLYVAAQQDRHHLHVEAHQRVGQFAPSTVGHRLDPLAHAMHVGTIAVPAIEIEQRLHLLGHREAEQVAGVGAADFLERVEKRLGRERLHQALGLGRGENQVALLARGQAVQEFELFLERKIEKFRFASYRHITRIDWLHPNCKVSRASSTDQLSADLSLNRAVRYDLYIASEPISWPLPTRNIQ